MRVITSPTARKALRFTLYLLLPAVVLAGSFLFGEERYAFLSAFVVVLSLLLFYSGIEKRKIGTRRLILVAVFATLAVLGRLIPLLKPVTALIILAGIYLGGEAGFLTGSLAAVLSNFSFGQGPWTPFQMLAWGMVGLLAGCLAKPLKKSRLFLLIFGALSGVFYSFVMDIWTVLWYSGTLDGVSYLAAITAALPYTVLYAISNVLFLLLLARPLGEKLERIRIKYGI